MIPEEQKFFLDTKTTSSTAACIVCTAESKGLSKAPIDTNICPPHLEKLS
jgi:hypothetical protein